MPHDHMPHPEKEFRAHLAEGRFMIQRSRSTGGYVFYPRVAEPGTGAEDLEWVEASGRGVVYAVTIVSKKDPSQNYNVALVDLEEGPRMMSRIEGAAPAAALMGMPVQARIVSEGGEPLVVFVPA